MQKEFKLMPIENSSGNTLWKMISKVELNLNLSSIFPESVTKLTTFSLEQYWRRAVNWCLIVFEDCFWTNNIAGSGDFTQVFHVKCFNVTV